MRKPISRSEFYELSRSLIGMPVSRVRKGFSTALLLELGDLRPWDVGKGRKLKRRGEAHISIEWNWRVESRTKVLIGSDQSNWAINKYIRCLKGLEIVAITLEDEVKNDLIVRFTGGIQLQTSRLKKEREDGEWRISLKDGTWLTYTWRGLVRADAHESVDDMSPEELEASRLRTPSWTGGGCLLPSPAMDGVKIVSITFHLAGMKRCSPMAFA